MSAWSPPPSGNITLKKKKKKKKKNVKKRVLVRCRAYTALSIGKPRMIP